MIDNFIGQIFFINQTEKSLLYLSLDKLKLSFVVSFSLVKLKLSFVII